MNKLGLLFLLWLGIINVILNCSQDSGQGDATGVDDVIMSDTSLGDISLSDTVEDTGIAVDKYFVISFAEGNEVSFFDREDLSNTPFYSLSTGGEVSSIEFDSDTDTLIYADRGSNELVFIRDFVEIKRIKSVCDYPYSIKYVPKLNLLVVPDRGSNRIFIIDTERLDFSSISPMSAGGNSPISVCFDESPLTQGLLVRLFILNYSSLYVRAYDIFDKEEWGLRGEKMPAVSEPLHIACDSVNRRLLVVNSASNNISAYGLDDLVQIANSPFEAGKNPTFAAIYSRESLAYITNTSDDSLTIFSIVEMKAKGGIGLKPQDRPSRVYVNESEQRLYVLLSGAKALVIYDIGDPFMPERLGQINFDRTPTEMVYK